MVSGLFEISFSAPDTPQNELYSSGSQPCVLRQYIGGRENRLVQVAVESLLADKPAYNPLIFYGRTGTGKTLLAEGLVQQWNVARKRRRALVVCGSDFARAYADAVDTQGLVGFRRRHREVGLLAIDDIHEMRRKATAQLELVRTFDVLLASGAVIVVTASAPPAENQGMIAALRSRLAGGLTVPLTTPGLEARVFLLRRFAELHELELPDDAVSYLAAHLKPHHCTVPQLNKMVLQLCQETPPNDHITPAFLHRFIARYSATESLDLSAITFVVSRFFSVSVRDLRGPLRKRHIVRARGVAMYLAWHLTDKSLDAIGKYFGKRDHTTVLHACRKTEVLRDSDPAIDHAIVQLTQQLEQP